MRRIILFLLILRYGNCEKSSQYLQNAVRDLRRLNHIQTLRRADIAMAQNEINENIPLPQAQKRIQKSPERVPTLGLTKGELAALYENAIAKGDVLKLNAGDDNYIHAAVHELDEHPDYSHSHSTKGEESKHDGYYYYYYPIKSFLDEMTSQSHDYVSYKPKNPVHVYTTSKPPYTIHSHHHEHNINIKKEVEEKKPGNKLEPLFMAISGFVGMAVMFVISMIILPKFGSKPKKSIWPKTDDMDELARLAWNAIEGNDCRERFACELSKTARNFNIQENRFIKLLRRIAPGTFGKDIDRFSNYGNRQLKCTLIPCKRKFPQPVPKNTKKTSIRKKNPAQKKN